MDTDNKHTNPWIAWLGVKRAMKDEHEMLGSWEGFRQGVRGGHYSEQTCAQTEGKWGLTPSLQASGREAAGGLATEAKGGWVSSRENIQNERRKGWRMKLRETPCLRKRLQDARSSWPGRQAEVRMENGQLCGCSEDNKMGDSNELCLVAGGWLHDSYHSSIFTRHQKEWILLYVNFSN